MSRPPGPVPPGPDLPPPDRTPAYHPVPEHLYGATTAPRREHLPPPSKKMAGWALGLAIVPCCGGITTLVGLGLGITVLVKSRDGRDHGRGLAIAAIVIAALWIVVGIVAAVAGVFTGLTADAERDGSGRVTSREEISINKVRAGDCLDYPELANGDEDIEATTVTAVPCKQPHQYEAYHEVRLEDGGYPGEEEVGRRAEVACLEAFRDFVGTSYRRSRLETSYLYPTASSWRLLDDRTIVCLLGKPGGGLVGSVEGSRR